MRSTRSMLPSMRSGRSLMISLPSPIRSANQVADLLEIESLAKNATLGPAALEGIARRYRLSDADLALGSREIRHRGELLGDSYPFRTAGGSVAALAGAVSTTWVALLLLGALSPIREMRIHQASVLFEELVCEAMGSLFGDETKALRFGWPSDVGRPQAFPDAVRWLAGLMDVPVGSSYRPPATKDGGVDVVAWRPFGDGRSGFPVALVQCTLERDFAHKANDIDLRVWSGWLSLDFSPMSVLAVPDVVGKGQEWDSLAARVIVIDRVRLSMLGRVAGINQQLFSKATDWVHESVTHLRENSA